MVFFALCCVAFTVPPGPVWAQSAEETTILPTIPVTGCRGEAAKLYDECGSQMALFERAQDQARQEGKIVLVSYGAEWCIWCHVFDAYIRGEHTEFTHTYSDWADEERYTETIFERALQDPTPQAEALEAYFRESFVLVHIESRYSKDGDAVLERTGADAFFDNGLPFIFSVTSAGAVAAVLETTEFEKRREWFGWFRGYDRNPLLIELMRLKQEASGS